MVDPTSFIDKHTKTVLAVLVIFLFSISLVLANPDNYNWGNSGAIYGNVTSPFSFLIFGSNYPQGSLDFSSNVTITTNSVVSPIIVDLNKDGTKELYTFQTSSVSLIDSNGDFVNSVELEGTICGIGTVALDEIDGYNHIVIATEVGVLDINVYELKNTDGTLVIDVEDGLAVTDLSCGGVLGGIANNLDDQHMVYIIQESGNVFEYNINNNDYDIFPNTGNGDNAVKYDDINFKFMGGQVATRQTPSGSTILAWATQSGDTVKLNTFNIVTETFKIATLPGANTHKNISVGTAFIGSISGGAKLIVTQNSPTSNLQNYWVYDYLLNLKYSYSDSGVTGHSPFYCVADVDHDGMNEFCYPEDDDFECYDGSFNLKYEFNMSNNLQLEEYFMCAEYQDNGESFHEIIGEEGIFQVNLTNASFMKIGDLGTQNSYSLYLPVALSSNLNFTKDILAVATDEILYFVASGTVAVCGDGICSPSENVFSCYYDCTGNATIPVVANESIGALPYLAQCLNNSWCASGSCTGSICDGFAGGLSCNSSSQCASGVCNDNDLCDDVGFATGVSNLFESYGVNSSTDRLLLGLILVILITLMAGSGMYKAGALGMIIGGGAGFLGSIFIGVFVLGWLPVWIVFMLFIGMIGFITILLMLSKGG